MQSEICFTSNFQFERLNFIKQISKFIHQNLIAESSDSAAVKLHRGWVQFEICLGGWLHLHFSMNFDHLTIGHNSTEKKKI